MNKLPSFTTFTFSEVNISHSQVVRNLGVVVVAGISHQWSLQVHLELIRMSLIRLFLSASVIKHLWCFCSVPQLFVHFINLHNRPLEKVQRAENNVTRVVFRWRNADHVTSLLRELHSELALITRSPHCATVVLVVSSQVLTQYYPSLVMLSSLLYSRDE